MPMPKPIVSKVNVAINGGIVVDVSTVLLPAGWYETCLFWPRPVGMHGWGQCSHEVDGYGNADEAAAGHQQWANDPDRIQRAITSYYLKDGSY